MALEVYYQEDIRNALLAAEQANSAALMAAREEENEFAQGYQEGYRAALTTIALAFGLIQGGNRHGRQGWQSWSDDQEDLSFLPAAFRRNGRTGRGW